MMRTRIRGLHPTIKKMLMVGLDLVLIPGSLWLALSLRLGQSFTDFDRALLTFAALTLFTIPVFVKLGLYRAVMRFLGWRAIEQIMLGVLASSGLLLALMLLHPEAGLPRSVFIIYGLVAFFLIAGSRFMARWFLGTARNYGRERVAIYGAGASGRQLVGLLRGGIEYAPVVFLDDDAHLHGREMDGLRVLDPQRPDLVSELQRLDVQSILLCMPSASLSERRAILTRLEPMPFHVRTVPGIHDILSGAARLDQVQEVAIEDLLGREPVPPQPELMHKCIAGKTVLVTGAGGSIGAELCRQVVAQGAVRLILLDVSEFALYQIDRELQGLEPVRNGATEVLPHLGSVIDARRLGDLFEAYSIDTVYHAAAYKHVPLVEHNPVEGLNNNAVGTLAVADQAAKAGVSHFVLISTDKAVRPTNVMGASKRLAEMALQALQPEYPRTTFSMVRFGNVLGSSGSVVPLFREQIRSGKGVMTVTHPEINRFFMTIPEAVQLVIQAGAMAHGGEVFVLDMGEPVRIVDLARRMIRLSGLEVRDEHNPDGDIEIVYTGLRPGEKLYEELLIGDAVSGTEHPKIMRAEEEFLSWNELMVAMAELQSRMDQRDIPAIRECLVRLVKGYVPHERIEDWVWCQRQSSDSGERRPPAHHFH